MPTLENIASNCIIICPSNIKKEILNLQMNNFPDKKIKYISKSSIIKNLYFDYDYGALYHLHKEYGYSYENAQEIMANLTNIKRGNDKLDTLYNIYLDLLNKNLLITNPYFKEIFKDKNVYVYGYSNNDIEIKYLLDELNIKYEYIEIETNNYTHKVSEFKNIDDEVKYVFNTIFSLLSNGVDINNIYFYNYPSEYNLVLEKYCKYHNIILDGTLHISLYDSPIYKEFLELLNCFPLQEAYDSLKSKYENDEYNVVGVLTRVLNKLIGLNLELNELTEFLNFIAKGTTLSGKRYDKSIKICHDSSLLTDKDHVFMLGFSLGSYPAINKDTDFYSDIEKVILNKNTSKINSYISEEKLIKFITNTKNLHISYKNKLAKQIYYPSLLISKLNMEIIKPMIDTNRYSKDLSELEISKYKDLHDKFGYVHELMNAYNDEELKFKKYDHKFKHFAQTIDSTFLSHTSINEYNKCPFHYFVKRVLKADVFEASFEMKLGNLFHKILEESVSHDVNLSDFQDYINENFPTYKEKFFVYDLLPQVLEVIKLNNSFLEHSKYQKVLAESSYKHELDASTIIYGKIDKTMIDDEDKSLIVVDYKTGDFKFDKTKIKYGVDMQLPIYAYLLKCCYPEYTTTGMYVQNVCLDKPEENKERYYLDGITLSNLGKIKRLDTSINTQLTPDEKPNSNSHFIKKIKLTKQGALGKSSSSIIPQAEIDNLVETAKTQIELANENIKSMKFDIAPLNVINKSHGDIIKPYCQYCPYGDICFHDKNDINVIVDNKEE